MNFKSIVVCLLLSAAVTLPLLAQGQPMARVRGRVTETSGEILPGVTVTLASPQLQGRRVLITDTNGVYNAPPVLPGEYDITFQLEGYQTLTRRVRLGASMHLTVDARLDLATVVEAMVVTGEAAETISRDSTAAVTIPKKVVDDLPVTRTLESSIALAPGVAITGSEDELTISGADPWQNLFTLNGVVLNTNYFGTPHPLYIEDAIQEITTATAGISAEWGRFTGGVVTAVTRSGGNRFEGSYRGTWTSEDWNGRSQFTSENGSDKINRIDEATLGGRVLRDHLWFFLAGRDFGVEDTATTKIFNIAYPTSEDETRFEVKLTGGTASHQLQLSHIEIDQKQFNVPHGGITSWALVIDDGTLAPVRSMPSDLSVLSYSGVLTPNLFLEAQYSERNLSIEGHGGRDTALYSGTPIWDFSNDVIYNESIFCDSTAVDACADGVVVNDNEQARIKGSLFISSQNLGSHDAGIGWEEFAAINGGNPYQTPTNLLVVTRLPSELDEDALRAYPTVHPGLSQIWYLPIMEPARPSDYRTTSFFANDRWRLSDRWSFNIGVRYDANDSVNTLGLKVVEDSAWGPRIGATYDLGADGRNVFHTSYAVYVGPQAGSVLDLSSNAGQPAAFWYNYNGPPIGTEFGNRLDPVAANRVILDWFAQECPGAIDFENTFNVLDPFDCDVPFYATIPGVTEVLDPNLSSTTSHEVSLGYQHEFGRYGSLRADYVRRDFRDFHAVKRDLETGRGVTEQGKEFDQGIVVNVNDLLERKYDGLHTAFHFRFLESRLRLGGSYTWSHARGRDYFTVGATHGILEWPEYRDVEWSYPRGDLAIDQRHRLRTWAMYEAVSTQRHRLNVSWMENLSSGTPYSAGAWVNVDEYVTNPGYVDGADNAWYYFSARGAFNTDSVHRSDLAINYSFSLDRWEFFAQPAVRNLFNESAVRNVNDTVFTNLFDSSLTPFDPFTETPIEGVHWRKGDHFGRPQSEAELQLVRTFSFTAGIRFNP